MYKGGLERKFSSFILLFSVHVPSAVCFSSSTECCIRLMKRLSTLATRRRESAGPLRCCLRLRQGLAWFFFIFHSKFLFLFFFFWSVQRTEDNVNICFDELGFSWLKM